ncbi:MAG: hypothetical protein IPM61_03210 [Chlorobi bacterium]|nr:MAG: hypothetical protein UZ07_CHB004001865 [Chlorobi bacterium OLB7]MBK8910313.1 hypothetical protein [Chlorobiota bacterium]MBX7218216.1 hypothetical protein [Candidatus Kapabacteria bacterium]
MNTIASAILALVVGLVGCKDDKTPEAGAPATPPGPMPPVATVANEQWHRYWSQGKAELSRYQLTQARYGELHRGDALLVFVTEDFLTEPQVKLESDPAGRPVASVLKLNFTKKFLTGIYPYSLMASVFTPVEVFAQPRTLKVSTTVQEWCGHVFMQLNLKGKSYNVEERSYFEREGDKNFALDTAMLEDEIWTRIRIAPQTLPVGTVKMIPGTLASRLRHKPLGVVDAKAELSETTDSSGAKLRRYTITYGAAERVLAIDFKSEFPHQIVGWTESYDDFGKPLTTTARLTHTLMTDYWRRHSNADSALRKELGLGMGE